MAKAHKQPKTDRPRLSPEEKLLRQIVKSASKRIEKVWAQQQELPPQWVAIGEHDIAYIPAILEDKDIQFAVVKAFIEEEGYKIWLFTAECWQSGNPGTPADDPDRKEVILLQAGDVETNVRIMATRLIIRDKEKSRLGPLTFSEIAWSRMDDEPPTPTAH